jgi:molybdenum cofactor cytidylyltransferase
MRKIIGILLAAGSSRRFGSNKLSQILPNGEIVAVQACLNLLAGTDQVLAVVRPGSAALTAQLQASGAKTVICEQADLGMATSLICGVSAGPEAAGWLIALADMPWVAPATIRQVAEQLRQGAILAAPFYQGRRGHPVGFSRVLGPELLTLSGDAGAQAIIKAHLLQLRSVACDDPGILQDIDLPEDLNPKHIK